MRDGWSALAILDREIERAEAMTASLRLLAEEIRDWLATLKEMNS